MMLNKTNCYLFVVITILYSCGCHKIVPHHKTKHHPISVFMENDRTLAEMEYSEGGVPVLLGGESGIPIHAVWSMYKESSRWELKPQLTILKNPMDVLSSRQLVDLGGFNYSWSLNMDDTGRLWVVYVSGDPTEKTYNIMLKSSDNSGKTWSKPLLIHATTKMIEFQRDSLCITHKGEKYLIFWRIFSGSYLDVLREVPGQGIWQDMGIIPESHDRSYNERIGFSARSGGELSVAYITENGGVRVYQSANSGIGWEELDGLMLPSDPGKDFTTRNSNPYINELKNGWGLVWQNKVSRRINVSTIEEYVDILYAKYNGQNNGWDLPVYVNNDRILESKETNPDQTFCKAITKDLEEFFQPMDTPIERFPILCTSEKSRMAVLRIEPVDDAYKGLISISDDEGISWSESALVLSTHPGDFRGLHAKFDTSGQNIFVIYQQNRQGNGTSFDNKTRIKLAKLNIVASPH